MNQTAVCGYGECPVCHGTGWESYTAIVTTYGEPEKATFCRRCPECTGIRRREDKTGVPEQFYEADYSKFNFRAYQKDTGKLKDLCLSFVQEFLKWEQKGKGMYLWSKTPGSGKTFLSCCLAKSAMIKHDLQMRFVTAPDYISLVGDSFKRERGYEDKSEIYRACRLLILDDVGAQKDGDWQNQELFRLINGRMEKGKVTLFTSNFPPEKLNLNDRTKDRIIKTAIVVQMPEESIRSKAAAQEQLNFLKEIGIKN